MAINVTLGEFKSKHETSFPKLMKYTDNELMFVILVTKLIDDINAEGVVVYSTNHSLRPVGQTTPTWAIERFTDYNEPITIQNA